MRDPPAPGYDANSGAAAQLRAIDVSSWGAEFWKNTRAGVRQHRLRWGRQALSENLKQVPTPSLALAFLTLAETFSQLPSLLKLFQKQVVCSQFIRAATAEKPVIFIKFVVWQSWFTDFILEAAQVDCPPVPRPFQQLRPAFVNGVSVPIVPLCQLPFHV